jgi:opacity protein-like surface antigen
MSERENNRSDSVLRMPMRMKVKNGSPDADHVVKFGTGFLMAIPQGEFRQVNPNINPWGWGVSVLGRAGRTPFHIGADAGFMGYGRSVETTTLPNGNIARIVRKNRVFTANLVARLRLETDFPIRPYLDGLVGAKYFRTATSIQSTQLFNSDNSNINAVNQQDIAFSYGAGGGLNIMLTENVWIDLRVSYLMGGTADYVKPGSARPDPFDPVRTVIDVQRSQTDLIIGQVGIMFSF